MKVHEKVVNIYFSRQVIEISRKRSRKSVECSMFDTQIITIYENTFSPIYSKPIVQIKSSLCPNEMLDSSDYSSQTQTKTNNNIW